MISWNDALQLLRRRGVGEERVCHSVGVASFAYDVARRIAGRHPELPLDPDKVRIAGLLHDIGRGGSGDHETESVRILREEGLDSIAAIVMHGTLYEASVLRGAPDPSLLPLTLENKIVAYADARYRLQPVSLERRFEEIKQRRANDKDKVRAVDMARNRFEDLERELEELAS